MGSRAQRIRGVLGGLVLGPLVAVPAFALVHGLGSWVVGLAGEDVFWADTVIWVIASAAFGAAVVVTTWVIGRAPWDGIVPCVVVIWAIGVVAGTSNIGVHDAWGPPPWDMVVDTLGAALVGGVATCWVLSWRDARRTRQQGQKMPNANQERFARAAQTWDENPVRVALGNAIAEAIRGEVPVAAEMDAMDCGCGTGLLTLALQPHVRSILGVDASGEMLKVLGEKIAATGLENVRVRQSDLAGDELDDERFDLVVSAMMLHHVKDAAGMVARLAGMLQPGGYLCLADLDAEDGSFHPDKTGIEHFGFDEGQMGGMFAAAGLGNVRVRVAHVIVRPDAEGVVREYPVLLTVGEKGG